MSLIQFTFSQMYTFLQKFCEISLFQYHFIFLIDSSESKIVIFPQCVGGIHSTLHLTLKFFANQIGSKIPTSAKCTIECGKYSFHNQPTTTLHTTYTYRCVLIHVQLLKLSFFTSENRSNVRDACAQNRGLTEFEVLTKR